MKVYSVLSFATLVHLVASSDRPLLQFDPNTTKDCAGWDNIVDGNGVQTCEYVRKYWGLSPSEFHEWNPSVGLDCTPWYNYASYCITTHEKLDRYTITISTPSTTTMSSTTPVSSLRPSPTAWEPKGCYAQKSPHSILEKNMNPNGDRSLTIPKCKLTCYRRAYTFAGVMEGNQCWCSNYVVGEWAKDQTDCNMPCAGDQNTICGGSGVFSVFKALENSSPVATDSVSSVQAAASSNGAVSPVMAAASSNGAVSNRAMFGMDF